MMMTMMMMTTMMMTTMMISFRIVSCSDFQMQTPIALLRSSFRLEERATSRLHHFSMTQNGPKTPHETDYADDDGGEVECVTSKVQLLFRIVWFFSLSMVVLLAAMALMLAVCLKVTSIADPRTSYPLNIHSVHMAISRNRNDHDDSADDDSLHDDSITMV